MLTTAVGVLDGGRGGFVADASGGIALYLDAVATSVIPASTVIRVGGTVDERYGQRTLRIAAADIEIVGPGTLPAPLDRGTGLAGEADEGRRLTVIGEVVETPDELADGLGVMVDDGSGPLRIVVGADAHPGSPVARGDRVAATGPLGQRDSSGTGSAGYRLFATLPGELVLLPAPSPSPTGWPSPSQDPSSDPSPGPTPSASPVPSPSSTPVPSAIPSPSPSRSPAPSPSPSPSGPPIVSLAAARLQPIGSVVRVAGVVTAEAGRLGTSSLLSIEDGTAGILVTLPDAERSPARGWVIEVTGKLADPYGQLEIRPERGRIVRLVVASLPEPIGIAAADLGEGLEARLVRLRASVTAVQRRTPAGDLTVTVTDEAGTIARVMVDARAGIRRDAFVAGTRYALTGVVGQRATRRGALDGYRIWLRGPSDLRPDPSAGPSASPSSGPGGSPSPSAPPSGPSEPTTLTIAGALATTGARVGIEGVVTVGPALLDATGRRIVVQDPTAAIEILLPEARVLRVGDRIRATGTVGVAYGAPRLRSDGIVVVGRGETPGPRDLSAPPDAALEWRLARVHGRLVDVHRMGDRWRAEVELGGERILVSGLPGADVAVGRLREGAMTTVTGIVRRPYPTATDRRFAIVPRSAADIVTASGSANRKTVPGAEDGVRGAASPGAPDRPPARCRRACRPSTSDSWASSAAASYVSAGWSWTRGQRACSSTMAPRGPG